MVLAVLSVLGGALNLPGVETLSHWLAGTVEFIKPGEFVWSVALISTGLALLAILISWLLYGRRPLKAGEVDPLKKAFGPIFTGMERKWFVDELYWAVFVDRYVDISRFVADVIDGKFWHDWFHEKVIVGTYNWLSHVALNQVVDQRGIDAFFNSVGEGTKDLAASLRRFQNGFVRSYALFVLIGVVAILGYLLFK
jgi:NADH-quinone oxidoreductase subunit L